ncbi:acetyl-CoA carboxylase biotin carboxyl carrier protein [Oceanobacillus saliphilus]|uniref:acetyl-CoA carboxylase biotin carboxyl carrier protein n=1 Tax=Oceanobacillus saliphilus TaxID=2925834 RepID=UPI00201D96A7|nr:acetyl-CoA carboxylase biotin carboxyl carrier protein [Oceanobacillus saliphilus]
MLKVQEIREIIKLIDQSSITEFTYETNGTSVSLKKESAGTATVSAQPAANQQVRVAEEKPQAQIPVESDPSESVPANETTSNADYDYEIVSPMVGTFYTASSPENDPYVSTGSSVKPDTVVCIVEAMKLFNEIEAEVSGEIVEILAENGQLVEYGQPLFRVKKK